MEFITEVIKECNTFKFYVEAQTVRVVIHTDFAGTSLEEDFPNGDTSAMETDVIKGLSNIEAVNLVGSRVIENWANI